MEEKQEELYMPYGVKNRVEYFNGFGKSEVFIVIISIIAAIGIYLLLSNLNFNMLITLIICIFSPLATAVMIAKDSCNTSFIDQIRFILKFNSSQKMYSYRTRQNDLWLGKS